MKSLLKNITLNHAIFLILLTVLSGCIKEKFDSSKLDTSLTLKPGLAIPIGYSHIGIEKYLNKESLKNELLIAPDGFLSLFYRKRVTSGVMSDLLTLQNSVSTKTILNNTASIINIQTSGATFDIEDSISMAIALTQTDARIDSITLLSGTLGVNISSTGLTGIVTYKFPGLFLNSVPLTTTRNIIEQEFTLPLSDYKIVPEHDAGGNSLIKCIISLHLQTPSGPVGSGAALVSIQLSVTNLNYITIYGDFSGYNITLPTSGFSTGIFQQVAGGHFEFADPKMKLLFSNSVGVPLGISFTELNAIDPFGVRLPFTGPGIPDLANPKIINYPSVDEAGQSVWDSLHFDRTNSNLRDILMSNPDSIGMTVTAGIISIPGQGTSFISHDARYAVDATFELPLWGKAEYIILHDTLDFDYLTTSLPPPDELEQLIVHLNITNSFPVSISPQIYLLDKNLILLDSLFKGEEMIEGATDLNGDGKADPHIQDPVDIDLPRPTIDMLYHTRYLVARGKILTTNFPDEDVRFYLSYFLDYNAGLLARLKIKTGK